MGRQRSGWSFGKSYRVGKAFRLNVSKKGIGYSFGVRGLRVSTGPRGTYLNAGRGGFRFWKRLDSKNTQTAPDSTENSVLVGYLGLFGIVIASLIFITKGGPAMNTLFSKVGSVISTFLPIVIPISIPFIGFGIAALILAYVNRRKTPPPSESEFVVSPPQPPTPSTTQKPVIEPRVILEYGGDNYHDLFRNFEKLGQIARSSAQMWIIKDMTQNLNWKAASQTKFDRSKATFQVFDHRFTERSDFKTNAPILYVFACQRVDFFVFAPAVIVRYPRLRKGEPTTWKLSELTLEYEITPFPEDGSPPSDAQEVGETWLFSNKDGSRDLRYTNNRIIPILKYAVIRLCYDSNSIPILQFQVSNIQTAQIMVEALVSSGAKRKTDSTSNSQRKPPAPPKDTSPYEILGIAVDASAQEIQQAYRELVKKYHPDRVTHLGEEFRLIAEQRMQKINEAYLALGSQT
jgi:hypothetical protein